MEVRMIRLMNSLRQLAGRHLKTTILGASLAMPSAAMAHHTDFFLDLNLGDLRINVDQPPREFRQRVWVEPVYRTTYDRVWVEPATQDVYDKVWVDAVYQDQAIRVWDGYHHRIVHENVLVCPGHYEEQHHSIVVGEGHWETVARQELVTPGHWEYPQPTVAYDSGDCR
jgi:hypothetical protein